MARRVFLHVGLPKTGTTYLQTLLWDNRDELLRQGVLLPGGSSRDHLWASGAVREDPHLPRRSPEAPAAWDRLVEEITAWEGRPWSATSSSPRPARSRPLGRSRPWGTPRCTSW